MHALLAGLADLSHRGRFQAQGGKGRGLQESEAWAQNDPLTVVAGHTLLDALHSKLGLSDQELRKEGFREAHGFVDTAAQTGGVGPVKKSFPKGKLRRTDGRVDVEVQKGLAFVPVTELKDEK
jgi:hypothetical protein